MPDLPNRDEQERAYAKLIAKLLKTYGGNILEVLGDPPSLDNIPPDFWDEEARRWVGALAPFGEQVYLDAATQMIAKIPIGVDWTLINERAVDWARRYTFDLVRGLQDTDRRMLQQAIGAYFEQGQTRGQLEERILRSFGPVRAEMIAVTEVTRAASEGEQQVAKELAVGGIEMVPIWQTNNDEIVQECPICWPRHNQPITDGFFPPAHPRCLPGNTLVLPIGRVAAGSERWYEGNIATIETLENQLTVTPNHPILTPSGWVAAGLLQEGDYILGYSARQWESAFVEVDNQDRISSIENIFSSFDVNGFRVPTAAPDFHGDGAGSDIAVIRPNREIMNYDHPKPLDPFAERHLVGRNIVLETSFTHLGTQAQLIERDISATASIVGGFDLARALLGGHMLPLGEFRLGLVTGDETSLQDTLSESPAIDARLLGKLVLRFSGDVSPQKIVKIGYKDFAGHVYNLQTESGLYIAAGIITHNCRCWVNYELPKVNRG